jgi:spore coat polysaccharide biosynthesis protein SpsF
MGHYRCTVDCLDDYIAILHVFRGIKSPECVSALDLLNHLPVVPNQPQQSKLVNKLVLGTAQLGLTYGIANESGKPSQSTAEKLIKMAISNGVLFIDTARSYGNSEEVIGNTLKTGWEGRAQVITKLSPMLECPVEASTTTINALVDASIYQSCMALRTQQLDILMLHRASQLSDWSGDVWARLIEHKIGGMVKALGVSVQSPEELKEALATPDIEFIQMPLNILDWRWDGLISQIKEAKHVRKLVIHARSALLQGLLPSAATEHWHQANVDNTEQIQEWLITQQLKAGCPSIANFCLRYVKSIDWVDGVVVGMENGQQLAENIQIFCEPDLPQEQILDILVSRPILGIETLNPTFWRK